MQELFHSMNRPVICQIKHNTYNATAEYIAKSLYLYRGD